MITQSTGTTTLTKAELDTIVNNATALPGDMHVVSDFTSPAPKYIKFYDTGYTKFSTIDFYTSEQIDFIKVTNRDSLNVLDDSVSSVAVGSGDVDNIIYTKIGNNYYKRILKNETANVKWWGATGDGSTNDTTAIQNAVAKLSSDFIYGSTLLFPSGKYLVTSTVNVNNAICFKGTPVFRYTTTGNADYEGGSVIICNGASGIVVFNLESARQNAGTATINHKAPSIENLHFKDSSTAGNLHTLLQIKMYNYVRVRNCNFTRALNGVKIDPSIEDASWCDFDGNVFTNNTICFNNTAGSVTGVPRIRISGGNFNLTTNQVGIQNEKAVYVEITGMKMDVSGAGAKGIVWHAGSRSTITDVSMEFGGGSDANSIGIFVDPSATSAGLDGLTISNCQMTSNNNLSTGIKILGGPSTSFPTSGIVIKGGNFASFTRGIWVNSGCVGVVIDGVGFKQHATAAIQLDASSYNHIITNIKNDVAFTATGGIVDNSTGSKFFRYQSVSGTTRTYTDGTTSFMQRVVASNTLNPNWSTPGSAVTGVTTEQTVFSGTLKAGTLGLNGELIIDWYCSCTNNANNKTFKVKIGGNIVSQALLTGSVIGRIQTKVIWRNSTTSCYMGGLDTPVGKGLSVSTTAPQTYSIDNTVDQAVLVTVTLGTGTDTAGLEQLSFYACY